MPAYGDRHFFISLGILGAVLLIVGSYVLYSQGETIQEYAAQNPAQVRVATASMKPKGLTMINTDCSFK